MAWVPPNGTPVASGGGGAGSPAANGAQVEPSAGVPGAPGQSSQPTMSGTDTNTPPGGVIPSPAGGSGATEGLRTIPISNAPYRVLSRLTDRQYVNAAGQLLGIDAQP